MIPHSIELNFNNLCNLLRCPEPEPIFCERKNTRARLSTLPKNQEFQSRLLYDAPSDLTADCATFATGYMDANAIIAPKMKTGTNPNFGAAKEMTKGAKKPT